MKSIFDLVAPIYRLSEKLSSSRTKKEVLKNIETTKGDKILDMGGGTGKLLSMIKNEEPDIEFILLDVSKSMMKHSSKSNQKVLGKACRAPFDSNSFDLVITTDALHHFKNKKEALKEMVRLTKPEGTIVILEFGPKSYVTKFIKYGEKLFGEPSYFFEIDYLRRFFEKHDLKTELYWVNSYEYILEAKKTKKYQR